MRALVACLEQHPADTVLTSTDAGLTILHKHREEISRHAVPAIPSVPAVETALSKQATVELAERLGIPVPRSLPAASPDEVDSALAELGLPAVIKPLSQWNPDAEHADTFRKPRLVETRDEARAAAAEMVSAATPVLVQEMVTGGLFEHHQFFRANGRIVARVTLAVDRQWPPFGISAMRTTVDPPSDTGAFAERLVEAIDIEGCSSVQFKRDDQGRARLMEVNARLVQTLAVAALAGVDFARLQLEWARGGPLPAPRYRTGLRVGWLSGDMRLLASSCSLIRVKPKPRFWPTLKGVAGDYLLGRARVEGFDLHDPKPMLASAGAAARSLVRLLAARERPAE